MGRAGRAGPSAAAQESRKNPKGFRVDGFTSRPPARSPATRSLGRFSTHLPQDIESPEHQPPWPSEAPKARPWGCCPCWGSQDSPQTCRAKGCHTESGDLQSQSNVARDREAGGDHAAMGAGGQCWPGQYWAVLKLERPFWTFAKCCITARRVRASSGRRVQAGHGSGTGTLVCWCQGNPAWPTLTAKGFDSSQKLRNQPRKSNSKDVKHQELMFTSATCAGLVGERWHILTQMALCAELQTHWLTLRDRAARPVPPDTLRDLLSGM